MWQGINNITGFKGNKPATANIAASLPDELNTFYACFEAHHSKAQQRMYFLRQLKKFNLPQAHMTQFYSAVIESVLCSSITVWFGSASKSDIRRLQRTVRTAERIIGVHLPSLPDLYYSRVKKRAGNIITDPSHPGHDLFALLPSGRRYRSLCTRTSRHKNSFSPMPSPA